MSDAWARARDGMLSRSLNFIFKAHWYPSNREVSHRSDGKSCLNS